MNGERIFLLLVVLGVLVHYGKHYVAMALLRRAWARNRALTAIVAFVVLYAFFPALVSSLMLPAFAVIAIYFMMRTR